MIKYHHMASIDSCQLPTKKTHKKIATSWTRTYWRELTRHDGGSSLCEFHAATAEVCPWWHKEHRAPQGAERLPRSQSTEPSPALQLQWWGHSAWNWAGFGGAASWWRIPVHKPCKGRRTSPWTTHKFRCWWRRVSHAMFCRPASEDLQETRSSFARTELCAFSSSWDWNVAYP